MSSYSQQSSEISTLYVSLESKNITNLLQQLNIKSLALDKANDLIKILAKQLEILQKLSQEYLKEQQQTLRAQYQQQIDILKRDNYKLQNQLNILYSQQSQYEDLDSKFNVIQLKNKILDQLNKKQKNPQYNLKQSTILPSTSKKIYKPFININNIQQNPLRNIKFQELIINMQFKQGIIDEINAFLCCQQQTIKSQAFREDLPYYFDDISILKAFLIEKQKQNGKKMDEMKNLLQKQRIIIYEMKQCIQTQSEFINEFLFKMKNRSQLQNIKMVDISFQIFEIKVALDREKIKKQHRLQLQNNELKQIINQMISLFKKTSSFYLYS